MKNKYEEVNVNDIKIGDRIRFDNRELYTVTAVSENFIVANIKQFGNLYYTLICKKPIDYDFQRNFTFIPKGSYYRGACIYMGDLPLEDDQESLNYMEREMLENRKELTGVRYGASYTEPDDYISQRNRVGFDKIFRHTCPETIKPPKRYPVDKPYLRYLGIKKDNAQGGLIGELTNLTDRGGNILCVGDYVEADYERFSEKVRGIIILNQNEYRLSDWRWKKFAEFTNVKKIKSYKDLQHGDTFNRYKAVFHKSKKGKG